MTSLPSENFCIKASEESPSVCVKQNGSILCLCGRSNSAKAAQTFQKMNDWLNTRISEKNGLYLRFEFKLEFYNSLTAGLLFDFLLKLENLHSKKNYITVYWYHEKFDADMKEAGETYAKMLSLPFIYVEK